MNSAIRDELILMMNVYGDISDDEQIKIISACSKILDNVEYAKQVGQKIIEALNAPNFDINVDFISLIIAVLDLNKQYEFYKELCVERMRIIIYGVIYSFLLKGDNTVLQNIEMHKLRLLYYNSVELLLMDRETMKMAKTGLLSSFCCFGWCGSGRHRI